MKVIHLIQKPQLRGAEIFACQLSTHLLNSGHEVLLISLFQGDAILPFAGRHINLGRLWRRRMFDLAGWRQLSSIISEFNADIVQANAGDTLKFASMSKRVFRWKPILVFRNANKVSDFIDSPVKRLLNQFYLRQVDFVISVSDQCRIDFTHTYRFPTTKIVTIPVGVETESRRADLPVELRPLFQTGRVLVNVGSLVPEKNHLGLIRIFHRLWEKDSGLKLLILGDGRERPKLEIQIRKLGLANSVHLAGYRSDVLSLLPHTRALLLPSRIEGLPAVILEAFFCGIPVVAYNVGGIAEIVKHHETGWLLDKDDEESFVDAVFELLNDPTLVTRVRENALRRIKEEFENRCIAKRFVEFYNEVMAIG